MGTIYQWKVYKKDTFPVINGVSMGEGAEPLLSASLFWGRDYLLVHEELEALLKICNCSNVDSYITCMSVSNHLTVSSRGYLQTLTQE